jgi:cytochrome c-type biogenesis protein CcmH/NrfG
MASKIPELEARAEALHGEDTDEVLEVNREILRLRPGHIAATNRLGIALLARGEKEEARKVFVKGLDKNPANAIAARRLEEIDTIPRPQPKKPARRKRTAATKVS